MSRDDIIRMGSEADLFIYNSDDPTLIVWLIPTEKKFLKFAALVAAAEREACAEICRAYAMPDGTSITAMVLEKAIRARGDQT